jgi:hypothetical protein
MAACSSKICEAEGDIARTRNKLVLEQAYVAGLLGPAKDMRVSGRVG